jgi:hypothetical protein
MTLNPESWVRRQLRRLLWQGPGAVSAYVSIPAPLICVALAMMESSELGLASLVILSINVALGVLLIFADQIECSRHHNLGLLRYSAAQSRVRIEKIGVRSKEVDQFVRMLWYDPELELRFKRTPVRTIELMVVALDVLSQLAFRYGRGGKRVFEANQEPVVKAMHLFRCLTIAEAESSLLESLMLWLRDSPEFDPEGWALPLLKRL